MLGRGGLCFDGGFEVSWIDVVLGTSINEHGWHWQAGRQTGLACFPVPSLLPPFLDRGLPRPLSERSTDAEHWSPGPRLVFAETWTRITHHGDGDGDGNRC